MKLSQVFVDEILGERRQTYECFVANDVHYLEESSKFLHDGFFASSLGDLMPSSYGYKTSVITFNHHHSTRQPAHIRYSEGRCYGRDNHLSL